MFIWAGILLHKSKMLAAILVPDSICICYKTVHKYIGVELLQTLLTYKDTEFSGHLDTKPTHRFLSSLNFKIRKHIFLHLRVVSIQEMIDSETYLFFSPMLCFFKKFSCLEISVILIIYTSSLGKLCPPFL